MTERMRRREYVWTLVVAVMGLTGCAAPHALRIDRESANPRRCVEYDLPLEWSFPGVANSAPKLEPHGELELEARRNGDRYLLKAVRRKRGGTVEASTETVAIGAGGSAEEVSEVAWQAAAPVVMRSVSEEEIEPQDNTFRDRFEFACPSPSGKRVVRVRYECKSGLRAPQGRIFVQVVNESAEKPVWSASGRAPNLPPIDQLAAITWLDDETLLWPLNKAATFLIVCWSIPG